MSRIVISNKVIFFDDFNYENVYQLKYSGWRIIGNENYVETADSRVVLNHDCVNAAWLRLPIRIDIRNYQKVKLTSTAIWLDGLYGSIHIIFRTNNHTYAWWRDGYYNRLRLTIDGKDEYISEILPIDINTLHNISAIIINGTIIKLYFDDRLIHTFYPLNRGYRKISEINEIGINPALCSKNGYDKIIIEAIGNNEINVSINKNFSVITNNIKNGNLYISTLNPLIISTDCNKNIIKNIEKYISNETVGINTCFSTKYKLYSYEDLLNTLNINKSIAVFSNDKETILYAYLLATKLNLPLIQNPTKDQLNEFKPVYNITTKDQAIKFYIQETRNRNEEIDGIVLVNINSENAFIASRLAALYNLFPIFINITEINYSSDATQANINNKVFEIRKEIIDTIDYLSRMGFFYRSKKFMLKNKDPYVIIIGEKIPYFELKDPIPKMSITCMAGFCDDFILTDSPYCNFNKTLQDISKEILLQHGICSRIIGSLEEISYQIEMLRKYEPENSNILIINDYSDLPLLSWLSFSKIIK